MATLTQANRLIAIDTPLGPDVLLLRRVTGQEGISQLFSFELDLLSTDAGIKFEDIIGKNVTVRVAVGDDKVRFVNGFTSRFRQLGNDTGLANYQATMVPWLWFLSRTTDCRIFQNLSVPDIVKKIFSDLGFSDFKFSLKGAYQPWAYCVQYRETDLNFVARLMEQEGIFFYFEHEEKKHTLIIADDPSVHQPCSGQSTVNWNPQGSGNLDESVVTDLQLNQEFRPGKYALSDYNFETPNTSLMAQVDTTIAVGNNTKFELYDYPGEYATKDDGDTLVKVRMQEEEAQQLEVSGSSSCRTFTSGYRFTLDEYFRPDLNREYLLTNVHHSASLGNSYTSQAEGSEQNYNNHFVCIPYAVPYRPQRVTPRPVVQGPQTAVVVGPSEEEIYVDKYGRVKVQFFWDREGKKDENSSCWVRVAQNWAGKRWGAMFLPRIGQEVIVEFMEGDPDQPIITGRVYNAEQMPPYELPTEQTKSTIKTMSSKGGEGFNELRFEDKKGEEQIFIHAQNNMDIRVANDRFETIGKDGEGSRHLVVEKDKLEEVKNDRHEKITRDHIEEIGRDRNVTVKGKEAIDVTGSHSFTVTGDVIEVFKANHSEQTTGDYYLKASNIVIEAMTNVTIKVGGTYIAIEASGIKICGPQVEVEGQATAEIKSPMTTVKGDGMLTLKGGVVMIN